MESVLMPRSDDKVFSQESMLPSPDDQVPGLSSKDRAMQRTISNIENGVPPYPLSWSGPSPSKSPGLGPVASSALGIGPAIGAASARRTEREKSALEARNKAEEPIEKQITSELDEMGKASLEQVPLPKFEPPKPKEWQDGFQVLTTLAALGGLLTSQPLTTALNNFTGMLNGINEGNQQNYLKAAKEFDTAFKQAVNTNTQKFREYQGVLNNHRLSLQQKNNELRLIAKKYGDEVKAAQLEFNDTKAMIGLMLREQSAQLRAEEIVNRFTLGTQRLQAQLDRSAQVQKRFDDSKAKAQASLKRHYVDQALSEKRAFDKEWNAAAGDKAKQAEIEARFKQRREWMERAYQNMGMVLEKNAAELNAAMMGSLPPPNEGFEDITPSLLPED